MAANFNNKDSGIVGSMGSLFDISFPPRKMSCVRSPLVNSTGERTAIDELPDECIQEIFMRLAGRERSISACVSKCWLMLLANIRYSKLRNSNPQLDIVDIDSESESSNEELDMECAGNLVRHVERTKATDVRLASIAISTSSRGGLGKLSIRRTKDVPDIGLLAIASCCPSLSHLSLWNVASFGDKGLVEIAKECRLLKKLDLCHCPSVSNSCFVEIVQSSNLAQITIQSCANIGDESLNAIAKYCPDLQSISIKACPLVTDKGVVSVISECPMLTKVKLQALNITDFSLTILGNYGKAISKLIISGLQNVTAVGFWVMGNAPGLRNVSSLNISFCKITDLSLGEIVKGCPELMYLTLRECCFASDNVFAAFEKVPSSPPDSSEVEEYRKVTKVGIFNAIFTSTSKLKSLAIVKCMGIKDMVTDFPLLYPCESLLFLSIRSCHGFGTTGLCMIGRLCPKLRRLDLSGLNQVTANELSELFLSCNLGELTKVDLSHCSNLTDAVVYTLAEDLNLLEVLNLSGCHLITNASLSCIGRKCLILKELDISKCLITDYGVSALTVRGLRYLKVLSFSGCSMITDMSIPSIERMGASLTLLNIRDCHSITRRTIESLTEKLKRCKIIS